MKLYYKPGACSLASHIALIEADAEFTLEKTDTKEKRTESGEDFLTISPNGYVPALKLHDNQILTEGPAILQFIADTNPNANLAPKNGTVERALVNGHLNFIGTELHNAFGPLFGNPSPSDREKHVANIGKKLRLY